jgi:ATP-dependent DNA helicase
MNTETDGYIPSNDCGLVSNDSLEENELEAFAAPEAAAEEERRLRAEREAADAEKAKADPVNAEDAGPLEDKKFAQLEQLLNKSDLYTKFLIEQMDTVADEAAAEAEAKAKAAGEEPAPSADKKKGKRTRASPRSSFQAAASTASNKKAKKGSAADPTTPTPQSLLCPGFVGSLRDYQLKGVKWLISLYQNGLNGILADQMGLGKTIQTIAFLCHLRSKNVMGPHMVLGPLSTLPNWVAEFEKWAPGIPVILYHGSKQEREELRIKYFTTKHVTDKFPVIVTSYEIVLADIKFMQKLKWNYLIVDEGHRLKNMNCRLIRELKTLDCKSKMLLTGTPLQNNLTELWSLLNFLLPDVFSSLDNFETWFDFASNIGEEGSNKEIIAQEQRNSVISKLHSILKPFLLRRVKTDVETSLPGKLEVVLYAKMTDRQVDVNKQLAEKTLGTTMAKSSGKSTPGLSKLNNMLMQMRKCCNHPDLITGNFDGSFMFPPPEQLVKDCGKFALLDRLLNKLLPAGHKILIFSQMTAMLDLIDSYLDVKGVKACRIDGSVSWQERQAGMKKFNIDPDYKVFLLSTRAGGLGINLTAADTCIIYDSDWNPHQDLQAMDRCHRIGQDKPVLVLRLATAQSVEGKMLRRASSKLMLERVVIKKGAFIEMGDSSKQKASLGADELMDLLKSDVSLDDVPQSAEISDAMLDKILDRKHLINVGGIRPYPENGPGYEVVHQLDGSGLLQGVE